MYTNEKVIDLNKINFIVKCVNEIAPITKIGDLSDERRKELTLEGFNIRAAGSELTYDELLYLQEHIELIKADYDKIELNNIIINWVIIIQNINKALESRTIDEYLSTLKFYEVLAIEKVFGFDQEGVVLTENGQTLYKSVKNRIKKLSEQLEKEIEERNLQARKEGYANYEHKFFIKLEENKHTN